MGFIVYLQIKRLVKEGTLGYVVFTQQHEFYSWNNK